MVGGREIEVDEHLLSVLWAGGVVTFRVPMTEQPDFVEAGQPYRRLPSFPTEAAGRMRWPCGERGTRVKVKSAKREQPARVRWARAQVCGSAYCWLLTLEGV